VAGSRGARRSFDIDLLFGTADPKKRLPKESVPHNAKRRGVTRGVSPLHQMLEIYFDTDFLNMRSIFSLIASMAVEFD
jgi:hypothetical protein